MQFTVNRADLARELALARGVVQSTTTIPVLSHVLIEAAGDEIVITATDLDTAIRCSCAAKVLAEGAVTAPAKRFLDYVKMLPAEDVAIKTDDRDWISVASGRAKARMPGLASSAWPELPPAPEMAAEIPGDVLVAMIAKVEFAISQGESRFTLDGALLRIGGNPIMVATDGHRLALAGTDCGPGPGIKNVLVPRKAILQIAKLAAAEAKDAVIRFAHQENRLFFQIGSRLLTTRELTGNFPDYAHVMPKEHSQSVTIEREALKGAIERVAQFSDERSHMVKVAVVANPKGGGGQVVLSSSTSEVGESEEGVAVEFEGAGVQIGFCADYLLDFLRVAGADKVEFLFSKPEAPGELRAVR